LCKLVQRQTYTCLSHKFGIYVAYAGVVIVLYSFFHFSEELLVWSQNKYDVAFGAYHNNIAAKSFQNRLCSEDKISTNLTSQQNENTVVQCNFKDCIKLPLLVMLPSVGGLTTDIAKNTYSNCDNLQSVFSLVLSKDVLLTSEAQATFLRFETIDEVRTVQQMNNGTNQNLTLAHVTSDVSSPHSMQLKSAFILTSIPKTFKTEREVKDQLPAILKDKLEDEENYDRLDSALVDDFANEKGNSTLKLGFAMGNSYSKVEVKLAYLVGKIEAHGSDDVISRSRFEDNEELRYSLRSVVKYAPWVRHIYIVTNGQIPYWLNMDAPRISVITHDEIFVNKSHLPTFSSPAIEAHLHRIPGLADKFIYLNDDVMFGKEVWPDDFYTHADGYKVYLAWSVPNCAEGCAPSWITDGYCDAACNVSECDWDGGDCTVMIRMITFEQLQCPTNLNGTPVNTTSEPLKEDAELETVCYQFKVQAYPANNITNNTILHDQPPNTGGFLPWEADKQMVNFQLKFEENERKKSVLERYSTSFKKRKLLDTFGDSLLFVSRIFNKRFGFTQRKVPAHMPHMVDKNIMYELQGIYPREYDMTSSHRLRHSQDMQFAFSYFYYIMSELKSFDAEQVFDELDTDHSKVLSDREIRLLATQIFDLPLTLDELTSVETAFKQCAMDLLGKTGFKKSLSWHSPYLTNTPQFQAVVVCKLTLPTAGLEAWAVAEIYYDKDMPLVTKEVLLSCDYVMEKLNKTYSGKKKYNYVQLDESEVSFKMIRSNVSVVVGQLDDIRKHPKKFIYFYETLFPIQSQFELSHDYRNRFGNIFELREWKTKHERTLFLMHCILVILLVSIVISFFWDQIYRWWRKHRHRLFRRGILKPWKT
uniref:LNR domain-containing protein n=1 Tax=Ciona savignyi TaxID=51511 RepID=H2Z4G7_CIOSA